MMYEYLVRRLRKTSMDLGELDHVSALLFEAACVIEELGKLADAIPHVCECCIGCEVESGDCDNAFVLSPKRAKDYLNKPRWIPVTERLPEIHTNVLVVDKAHDMAVGSLEKIWDGIVWVCPFSAVDDDDCKITHWMPLPEPPKEGE